MNIGVIVGDYEYSSGVFEKILRKALTTIEEDFGNHGDITYCLWVPSDLAFVPDTSGQAESVAEHIAEALGWEAETCEEGLFSEDRWNESADDFVSGLDVIVVIGQEFPADIAREVALEFDVVLYEYT